MDRIAIYTKSASGNYYRSLLSLVEQGQLQLEFLDHRGLDWFLIKLWYRFSILRLLARRYTKRRPRRKEPSWYDLGQSLLFPFRLLRRRTVIVAFPPYSIMVYYFLLLKLTRKKIVYFTSWPYWGNDSGIPSQGLGTRRVWKWFLKDLRAVAVTKASTRGLVESGVDAIHIPHSVDINLFAPPRDRQDTVMNLLYVGRVVREKGVRELSEVFASLLEKYPHLKLTIVGDGPELPTIESKEGISCCGHITCEKELVKKYQASDIFVLNSFEVDGWQEFFGIALLEAMACGLPCVATDCVGPKELVLDGITGFLIPQRNRLALYKKLECLILDEDLRGRFGARARNRALDFAVDSNARKWLTAIYG